MTSKKLASRTQIASEMPFGKVSAASGGAWKGIDLLEGRIMSNVPIPFHFVVIDTQKVCVTPMANPRGNGYAWGDATVRGFIQGDWGTWMKDYFTEVSSVFRDYKPQDFVKLYLGKYAKDRVIMISDANGNLFWNLGHWIYTERTLHKHYREELQGNQTGLIFPFDSLPRIGIVDLEGDLNGVKHAVFGQRLIKNGKVVDLLGFDEETQRPVIAEFVGDFSHLVTLPFLPSLKRALFEANIELLPEEVDLSRMSPHSQKVFEQDSKNKLAKINHLNSLISGIVGGETVTLEIKEPEADVHQALADSDYASNDYHFSTATGNLEMIFKRSCFGHSLVGLSLDGHIMFMLKVYTDFSRRGLTLEETAHLMIHMANFLEFEVDDAVLMSNGGDLRVGPVDVKNQVQLIDMSTEGDNLLYRGNEDYGITSAFVFSEK